MICNKRCFVITLFAVLNTVKTHNGFLSVLENLSLSENNTVCFLVFNTIIKLCQLEKEETKREQKLLVCFILCCFM